MFKTSNQNKRALKSILYVIGGVFVLASLQNVIIDVSALVDPFAFITPHIDFGLVFPREVLDKNFIIVSELGDDDECLPEFYYHLVNRPKPRPEFEAEVGEWEARQYCVNTLPETDPDYYDNCYHSICDSLGQVSREDEGDTSLLASLSHAYCENCCDQVDYWKARLTVPPLKGHIGQDFTGTPVEEADDYGCDIYVELLDGPPTECDPEDTRSCDTGDLGICSDGTQVCDEGGYWGDCVAHNQPGQEICDNSLDDDCDGHIDCADEDCFQDPYCEPDPYCGDGIVNGNEQCEYDQDCDERMICSGCMCEQEPWPECTPGSTTTCATGQLGICSDGTQTCDQEGYWGNCIQDQDPADDEVCDNGLDDNCDGNTDCDDEGCFQDPYCEGCIPEPEVCDGQDNDCDELVDEDGVCGDCVYSPEVCDGQDNDCDGITDEGNPGGGGSCDTGLFGVCANGTYYCQSGQLQCIQNIQPSAEACNGLDDDCDGVTDEGCQTITGGGSGFFTLDLIIFNEETEEAETETATVTWFTNTPGTSRVIYDTVQHPILGTAPNYGYAFSTLEQDSVDKVTFHTVTITGLTPGVTYYWRAVSHGSPEVLGDELSFDAESPQEEEGGEEGPVVFTEEGPSEEEGGSVPPEETPPESPSEEGPPEEEREEIVIAPIEPIPSVNPLAALLADIGSIIGNILGYPCMDWRIILILIFYSLLKGVEVRKKNKKESRIWLIWSAVLIVLAICFYLGIYACLTLWIFIILGFITFLIRWFFTKQKKEDEKGVYGS